MPGILAISSIFDISMLVSLTISDWILAEANERVCVRTGNIMIMANDDNVSVELVKALKHKVNSSAWHGPVCDNLSKCVVWYLQWLQHFKEFSISLCLERPGTKNISVNIKVQNVQN